MIRIFAALAFLCTVSLAQPLEGPFTILQLAHDSELHNLHFAVRNDSIADVFYQISDTVYHAMVAIHSGEILAPPQAFEMSGSGWSRRLCDVTATDSGWAVLVYDDTPNVNRTVVYEGRAEQVISALLDSASSWGDGFQSTGSQNYALGLRSHPSGGFVAAWQFNWICWNEWEGWGCAGAGVKVFVSDPNWPYENPLENAFIGYWGDSLFTSILHSSADSVLVLISSESGINLVSTAQRDWGGLELRELAYAYCSQHLVNALATNGGRVFVLSRSGSNYDGAFTARLIELENFTSCADRLILDSDPIAAVSHPDFGMAWLSKPGSGLLITRADTTGSLYLPVGVIHWPDVGYQIADAALAISDSGLLVAVWSEREGEDPNATILRMASVGWDTYLGADEPRFIPHPSSFALSTYPNPFNSKLEIEFDLPTAQRVNLSVFNVLGQKVTTLLDARKDAGHHRIAWSPDAAGGIYFVQLKAAEKSFVNKVVYLK